MSGFQRIREMLKGPDPFLVDLSSIEQDRDQTPKKPLKEFKYVMPPEIKWYIDQLPALMAKLFKV